MDNKKEPLILITNDDGVFAKGIRSLIDVARKLGKVVVIAPDKPQSGMGHAITINNLLRLYPYHQFEGIEAYTCSGTPVDCVKLGIYDVLHQKPDLLLSGINHGENTSTNVLYSGTMSAAVEGAIEGIPSIGFSLADFDPDADFAGAQMIAERLIKTALEKDWPKNICLNVNVPKMPREFIKGIKVCRAARAFWEDRFEKRKDQFDRPYYWLTGEFVYQDLGEDTDLHALKSGYASIVPVQYDMTAYNSISELNTWKV
ncbi:MAG: 5'/3'-nucleotidase SurE [Bacteroidetes bacterium]|nr:MAG: 5'/3'-nucleotidase SurE [Bacteroidota bacterium]